MGEQTKIAWVVASLLLVSGCGPSGGPGGDRDGQADRDGRRDAAAIDVPTVKRDGAARDAVVPPDRFAWDRVVEVDVPSGPDPCAPIPGVSYTTLATSGPVTDRPADVHADLNIKMRGWEPAPGTTLGLVDIPGPTDQNAPKLNTMFTDDRIPVFVENYRIYNWDWDTNSRGSLNTDWEVTLSGFGTTRGEVIELPNANYDIGGGKQARVLYADADSITLKYTAEDNVVYGYTVHMVGICVEPSLKALYDSCNANGRHELPALNGNQPIGRARGTEVIVAIRDTGTFMDPRSRKDWW